MKKYSTYFWVALISATAVALFISTQKKHKKIEEMIERDEGVLTKLPPWSDEEPDISKLNPRNVLSILVNDKNQLIVRDELMEISELKEFTKEFISNPEGKDDFAERPTKAIVSLKNDRGTKYEIYLNVYNELKAAYNELRNEKAIKLFEKPYEYLEKEQQKKLEN